MSQLHFAGWVNSPFGDLLVYLNDDRLAEIRMASRGEVVPAASSGDPVVDALRAQLDAYFRCESRGFELPLGSSGSTFDLKVWAAIRAVPFGQTVSYSDIARRTGHPRAARAVGSANARNPLLIVTPCHRVVAADGRLCGSGAGRELRRRLLQHEGVSIRNGKVVPPSLTSEDE